MCSKSLFVFLALIFSIQLYGQDVKTLCQLPEIVDESSGIELADNGYLYTFNDSGGEPALYLCDTMCNLVGTYTIPGAKNVDWEDVARDTLGYIYIGDFGNNKNKRKDLTIYKISSQSIINGGEPAEKITFTYEDQAAFPPSDRIYDCESVIWVNGSLYLFTKHRTTPMATNIYKIPDTSGHHTAQKQGSFFTGVAGAFEHPFYNYWITAADISPDFSKLALLSGNKVFVFSDFEDDDFFSGKVRIYFLPATTQKEGICFKNNTEIYITDEYWASSQIGRNLYVLNINDKSTSYIDIQKLEQDPQLYPNPFYDRIYFGANLEGKIVEVLNSSGKYLAQKQVTNTYIDMSFIPAGTYYISMNDSGVRKNFRVIK